MKASTCKKGTPDDLKDRVLGLQGFGKDGMCSSSLVKTRIGWLIGE